MQWVFYLSKSKGGLGLAFDAHYLFNFSVKMYLILYQLIKFQWHTFFLSQDIKQKVLLRSHLDNGWRDQL